MLTIDELHPVSTLDLDDDKLEAIEKASGVPITLWGQQGSAIDIFRRILAAGHDVPVKDLPRLSGRKLMALATIDGQDDDPNP